MSVVFKTIIKLIGGLKVSKETGSYKLFNENDHLEKDILIRRAMKEFKIQDTTATKYYYNWKKEFTSSNNCVPKEEPKVKVNKEEKAREKFIFNEDTINSKEVKEYRINQSLVEAIEGNEDKYINPNLEVLRMEVKGKYGAYEKQGTKVKKGELVFESEKDIEEYKHKEVARFMAELGEILDVMLMGV